MSHQVERREAFPGGTSEWLQSQFIYTTVTVTVYTNQGGHSHSTNIPGGHSHSTKYEGSPCRETGCPYATETEGPRCELTLARKVI